MDNFIVINIFSFNTKPEQLIEAQINVDNFIVINIYNFNTESEELKTFSILQNMLDDIEISNKQIVLGGDFNLIFDHKLETNSCNPVLKSLK